MKRLKNLRRRSNKKAPCGALNFEHIYYLIFPNNFSSSFHCSSNVISLKSGWNHSWRESFWHTHSRIWKIGGAILFARFREVNANHISHSLEDSPAPKIRTGFVRRDWYQVRSEPPAFLFCKWWSRILIVVFTKFEYLWRPSTILLLFSITPCGCQKRISPFPNPKSINLYLVDRYGNEFLERSEKLDLFTKPLNLVPFWLLSNFSGTWSKFREITSVTFLGLKIWSG